MQDVILPAASPFQAGLGSNVAQVRQRVPVIAHNHRKSTPKYAPTVLKTHPTGTPPDRLNNCLQRGNLEQR